MTTSTISEQAVEAKAELKFCCDCMHLLGNRNHTYDFPKWRCVHPNNLTKNEKKWNLVTGIEEYIRVFKEESMEAIRYRETPEFCGPTAKWFEEYVKPIWKPEPTIAGVHAKEMTEVIENDIFPKDTLQANRNAAKERIEALKAKRKS